MADTTGGFSNYRSDELKPAQRRLVETINRLYHLGASANLQKILARVLPVDLAQVMESLPQERVQELFLLIPDPASAAAVLRELPLAMQQCVLSESAPERMVPVLEQLAPDVRTDIITRLEPELATRYMARLNIQSQHEVATLMQYLPDTAGGLMTSQFFALSESTLVREAIEAVRGLAAYEMVFYVYVLDDLGRLTGVSSLRQLLLAAPEQPLANMVNRRVVKVHTDTPQDEVAELIGRYRLVAMPVVDEEEVLVGLVTVDDVLQVFAQEATDDILRVAGTSGSEIDASSSWQVFRIRLPWLLTTFIGGLVASWIVYQFDGRLVQALTIVAFLPLILGLSGNFGTVAATVAARSLATGSATAGQYWTTLWREMRAAVLLGGVYGLLACGVIWLLFHDAMLCATVGGAIVVNMATAALVASLMPVLFRRLGADPTLASGPLVTMATDILGVMNYFLLATLLQPVAGV
jgi:magnesium transporter